MKEVASEPVESAPDEILTQDNVGAEVPTPTKSKIKPKDKYTLETVNDVEEFINELKSKMIEEINNGREITL